MGEMFYYSENLGSFKSRQHLINHVDMILGFSKYEQGTERHKNLFVLFDRNDNLYQPIWASDLNADDMNRLRKRVLIDSIYADKWMQVICSENENGDSVSAEKVSNQDSVIEMLNCAFDVWEEQEGNWTAFVQKTSIVVVMLNWETPVIDRIAVQRLPTNDEVDRLPVAVNIRSIISEKNTNDTAWNIFAERLCKNDFIKKNLRNTQNNRCAVCGRELTGTYAIHHVDYDHKCALYNSGLQWSMPHSKVKPDCEQCFLAHREWFDACVSRLRAVHVYCNYYIDHLQ